MAHFAPEEAFEELKKRTAETVKSYFPIQGAKNTLVAKRVWVEDNKDLDDIREQKDAKVKGRSWTVPIRAELELRNEKGKVIDRQVVNVAQLPKITRRYSYIVKGNEWQINNLFRMKSGVYTRVKDNGELQSQWNLAKGKGFNLGFNPKNRKMTFEYGQSKISLYPILKTMGVDDATIESKWGKAIFDANRTGKHDSALRKFYRAVKGKNPDSIADAEKLVVEEFGRTELRPDSTKLTLGTPYTQVTGSALLAGSNRILKVSRQEEEVDDRDSLEFKDLYSAEDLINERLDKKKIRNDVKRKVINNLDKTDAKIRNVVSPDIIGKPLRSFFVGSNLSDMPTQTNPVSFMSGNRRTTVFAPGEGGISSSHQITLAAQSINPSHIGFLDPIQTPECYDRETEVFTKDGWKHWDEVTDKDQFACRVDGQLEFAHASRLIAKHYTGPMYQLDSGKIHYLVTPNHRVLFSTLWRPDVWRVDQANRVHGKERTFDCGHEPYAPTSYLTSFQLPKVTGSNAVKNHGPIDMVDWAEFMGWFLSEGCAAYDEQESNYLVRVSQVKSANPDNWKILQALFDRMPQSWCHDGLNHSFGTSSKQLAFYLKEFGLCYDKYIPEYFFDASVEARESLFEALLLGDGRIGSRRKSGRSYDQRVFTTTSPRLADGFERLAIGLGHSISRAIYEDKREERYFDTHEVRVLKHRIRAARPKHPNYPANYKVVDFDDTVYCATVPGGLLLVRRGGVGFWCGNSDRIGVSLQMASHVVKKGHDLYIPVYNVKTGKKDMITPLQALHANVAFPDQYTWKGGKPFPVKRNVKVSDPEGTVTVVKPSSVDYVLSSPKGMFDVATNMIPFLQNNQGNRTMVASRQLEQAVSLKDREAPLVQVQTDSPGQTFEGGIGKFVSHSSQASGTVEAVKKDGIIIRDDAGKRHETQLYDDFPLNDDRSVLSSTPLVKRGDKVKKGQTLADTNFTREGTLALGTNLNVAYMPYKGYNFEDGIVISESAAEKLTSEHMYRESVADEELVMLDKKKFLSYTAGSVTKEQAAKLDDHAVVMEGQILRKDDVIIGKLKEEKVSREEHMLGLFDKSFVRPWKPREVRWTKDAPGRVTRVVKHGKNTTVYVRSESPAIVGDKIVGRHGNKGIITAILPDKEMPQTVDEVGVDVLLNPTGVPTRINLGQVLETAAGKLAQKKGKPYVVNNFDSENKDYTRNLIKELKDEGISDTEDLKDPTTGRTYRDVLTGPQYILKLRHTAEKGLTVRSREAYDSNMTPKHGGERGGQAMDSMGMYALLAHNARHNIREMQTFKSDMNEDFWGQLQEGDSSPVPKIPFVYEKFKGFMRGMGLDVKKEGNDLLLHPLTDKQVRSLSNGALANPAKALLAKNAKAEVGGTFDPKMTGGVDGKKWTHIELPDAMPNPVFEKPITVLLDLNRNSYQEVIDGAREIEGATGPLAISKALKKIDAGSMRGDLEKDVKVLRGAKLDAANKKLKYLRALNRMKMGASDAYMMKALPVMPPSMRPITILENGDINYADVNAHYNNIGKVKLKYEEFDPAMPPEERLPLEKAMYDGLKASSLLGGMHQGRHRNGIMQTIAGASEQGKQAKEAFFQKKIIGRRQDLSMRSVIIPEPSLGLDEVGLPEAAAAELYKPFVVQRLIQRGNTAMEAQVLVRDKHADALAALRSVVSERPILLKRDPVLHKFGVQAFLPKLVKGKAIKIHPLATSGFNADFDGDKMSAFVPVSTKAVKEARGMLPSRNLFSPTTGFLMSKPTQESMMGLYKLSEIGEKTTKRYKTADDAVKALKKGEIGISDLISLDSLEGDLFGQLMQKKAAPIRTTIGRAMLYQALPDSQKEDRLLADPSYVLDKKSINDLLTAIGRNTPGEFGTTSDRLKDIGNEYSTGLSIGLKDFVSDHKDRDAILVEAGKEETKVRNRALTPEQRRGKIVDIYVKAGKKISNRAESRANATPNRMYDWVKSGARGNWSGYRQMTVAPVLVADSKGDPVPIPITRAYSEGLDIASYFAAMHGARMGTIGRVQGTQEPGMLSKQLINTTMNQLIVGEDCGATKGVGMSIHDKDVVGRYTVRDVQLGTKAGKNKGVISSNTLVTPEVLNRLKNNKIGKVEVRSPLRCQHGKGMCAKCYGINEEGRLHPNGINVGIIAAQALGEPATQLSMNAFHSGGVVGAKGTTATGVFDRLKQLLKVPDKLRGAATLAEVDGKVGGIEKDPAGGWQIQVTGTGLAKQHYVPATRSLSVKLGDSVKSGDALSSGPRNPKEILRRTNMPTVQKYLTDEIWDAYKSEGPVRRRNVETFVRAMTNLSEVVDPGDHTSLLQGDKIATSEIDAYNRERGPKSKRVVVKPILKGIDMLPNELQTDWIARLQGRGLKSTIMDAAAEGWKSSLHGTHPIPGMAYGREFGLGTPDEPWLY